MEERYFRQEKKKFLWTSNLVIFTKKNAEESNS